MRLMARWLGSLVLAFAALPAGAAFHLFTMNELYSNADGSVQFLEFTALTGGQQFTAGHTIVVTQGAVSRTFQVPNNLPGDTLGHKFLVGTQGFAALGVVTPDYVVPNGFFPLGNGFINWGEGSASWNYSGLPTDGVNSLDRDSNGPRTNSPQNFAGQTGTVQLTAPNANYQALWWKAPAGSENGWGVNITHQGDILFATWFTYDINGSGMWLVMSNGNKSGPATYGGPLYRTTGPPFNSATWGSINVQQVGTLQFDFTDANNGAMTYTVNGITTTKAITRQAFSNPVSTCASGGTAPATPSYQDLWWKSPAGSENGWGVNLTHQGDILFATWFTYAADGSGLWLVMSNGNKTANGVYSGPLYRTTGPPFNTSSWDASQVMVTQVGTATFTFTDANNGTFDYVVNGTAGSKSITRQAYSTPTTCHF